MRIILFIICLLIVSSNTIASKEEKIDKIKLYCTYKDCDYEKYTAGTRKFIDKKCTDLTVKDTDSSNYLNKLPDNIELSFLRNNGSYSMPLKTENYPDSNIFPRYPKNRKQTIDKYLETKDSKFISFQAKEINNYGYHGDQLFQYRDVIYIEVNRLTGEFKRILTDEHVLTNDDKVIKERVYRETITYRGDCIPADSIKIKRKF